MNKNLLILLLFLSSNAFGQYCTKTLPDGFGIYADRFRLNTIDNSSPRLIAFPVPNDGYADFSSISTDVYPSQSYVVKIGTIGGAGQDGLIYVDWNQDFDFNDAEEEIAFTTAISNTDVTLTVPHDALLGSTRLRLVLSWNGNPSGKSSCNPSGSTGYKYGDVEDYTLNVGGALPIELSHFTTTNLNNKVELNWVTASEKDNDFFTIERSINNQNWEIVETIVGAGNSNQEIEYITHDDSPYIGESYYRLKQTDYNGDFTYSKINVVTIGNNIDVYFEIYPNPAEDIVTIKAGSLSEVFVLNSLGRVVLHKHFNNEQLVTLDLSMLDNGVYFIKSGLQVKKLIIQ